MYLDSDYIHILCGVCSRLLCTVTAIIVDSFSHNSDKPDKEVS